MKKLILAAVTFFVVSANAHAFIPRIDVSVNYSAAQFTIWNSLPRPIVCSGQVFGRNAQGFVGTSWVSNVFIPPYGYAYSYVYSNGYSPLVNAWANVYCH